jgi:hypothetical protein
MNTLRRTTLLVALLLVARCASAQEPLSFRKLSDSTPRAVSPTNRVRELRITWSPPPAPTPGSQAKAAPRMVVVSETSVTGVVRRERQPQLSEDQLVIVQRASDGRALDWVTAPDPRLIRAEVPGADGRLTGRIVHVADTELLVAVTQLAATVSLSVYQPRWTGTEFLLDLVGEVALTRTK